MASAVLDTNVLATGFVSRDTPPGQLLRAWRSGLFQLVVSDHILTELNRTLAKDYFKQRLAAKNLTPAHAVALLREEAILTPLVTTVSGVATHPEDDSILATVASSQVAYLVTGDKQLQKLSSFKTVTILSPADFLQTLAAAQREAA